MTLTDQREQLIVEPPDQTPDPGEPDPWEPAETIEPLVLLVVLTALLALCVVLAGVLLVAVA
jgi:hypothetical protein